MKLTRILCCWTLIFGISGCSDSAGPTPATLESLDPQMISLHGNLKFVRGAAGCQLAAEQRLPCMLFFTAEWCTFCHKMEETAFTDSSVTGLADKFVCVLVDADREPEICRELGVEVFPTILFVSGDGRRLHRMVGLQPASKLLEGMHMALERIAWLGEGAKPQAARR